MPKIDLTIYVENDPDVIFNLKKRIGRIVTPLDLTGYLVEFYVKTEVGQHNSDALKYASTGGQRHITIVTPPGNGQVIVELDAADVGGPEKQFYNLDVVKNSRRQTYAWGVIKKIGA